MAAPPPPPIQDVVLVYVAAYWLATCVFRRRTCLATYRHWISAAPATARRHLYIILMTLLLSSDLRHRVTASHFHALWQIPTVALLAVPVWCPVLLRTLAPIYVVGQVVAMRQEVMLGWVAASTVYAVRREVHGNM